MKTKHLTKKKEQTSPMAGLSRRQAKRMHEVTEAEAVIATEKNAEARERGEDLRLTYSQVVESACTKALLSMPEARERGERKLKARYDTDD